MKGCHKTRPDIPALDPGIKREVKILRANGIETFESCQGGHGHAYPEPTIRFHGHNPQGFRALAIALEYDLRPACLRRIWPIIEGEPTGPYWEMTFVRKPGNKRVTSLRYLTAHSVHREASRRFLSTLNRDSILHGKSLLLRLIELQYVRRFPVGEFTERSEPEEKATLKRAARPRRYELLPTPSA